MIEIGGQLDPEIAGAAMRGDFEFSVLRDLPEVLIADRPQPAWLSANWFADTYDYSARIGNYSMFSRKIESRPFRELHGVDVNFDGKYRLLGYALDVSAPKPGQPFRIRLDWEIHRGPAPYSVDMLLFQPPDHGYAKGTQIFPSAIWPDGRFSTYILMNWIDNKPGNELSLAIFVNYPNHRPLTILGTLPIQ